MNILNTIYGVLPASLVTSSKGRAIGPDLSHWEVSYDPSIAKNVADFAFTKATEGSDWIDPSLDLIWKGLEKVGINGLYHYQRSEVSWKSQANHFLTVASDYNTNMLALDVETINNSTSSIFFQDSFRIIQHLKAMSEAKILLYTSPYVFQNYLYPNWVKYFGKDGEKEALTIPLWIAQYWALPSPDKEPGMPSQRKTWDFWQWTSKGISVEWGAGARDVDLNVYNGTSTSLKAWLGLGTIPPIEPEPPIEVGDLEPVTETALWDGKNITTSNINIRSYPKVEVDSLTGQRLAPGQTVTGKLWSGNGYLWLQITESSSPLQYKWVAVRSIDGSQKLLTLTEHKDVILSPVSSFWRVKHDIELGSLWRPGMPEMHPLFLAPKTTSGTHFSPFYEWAQRLSYKANPLMTPSIWTSMYNDDYWITNGQGYGRVGDPRRNYILEKDLDKEFPKVESLTCGGSLIEGTKYGDWVKVKGLNYSTPITIDFLMANPQYWTRGVYVTKTGNVYRMLGDKLPGGNAIIHPLIVNTKYELWIQAFKLQEWTSPDVPDPLEIYS